MWSFGFIVAEASTTVGGQKDKNDRQNEPENVVIANDGNQRNAAMAQRHIDHRDGTAAQSVQLNVGPNRELASVIKRFPAHR